MKFLCDVHISIRLSKSIEEMGFPSQHVNTILDKWLTKDEAIASYADENNLILITKDQDFRNSFLLHRVPKKLVKINLGNISNDELVEMFLMQLASLEALNKESTSFMVEINKDGFWIVTR
jgi:predicted nuclease of predicted toxin-antitoxin system